MDRTVHAGGRVLLALIFVISGLGKIADPAASLAYMQSAGVPGLLLWPAIALESFGGAAIMAGFRTRPVAVALAGFCVLTALLFHADFGAPMQAILFLKNVSMAGGFLLLASSGASAPSIDAWLESRR